MSAVIVRQSGDDKIITLPKSIVMSHGLHIGSKLDISLESNKIVLTPIADEISLEELLLGSPKSCFSLTDEDRQWINLTPVGHEIL